MKFIYIIVLINLAIVCCGQLYPMKGYNDGEPIDCSNKLISKNNDAIAYSEDYCRSLKCVNDDYDDCFRCCYVHAKYDGKTYRGCYPMTYRKFANASELEPTDVGLTSDFTDLSIHCNSKYLTITASFIALAVALF